MSNYENIINSEVVLPADGPEILSERVHSYIPNINPRYLYNRQKDFKAEKTLEEVSELFEIESDIMLNPGVDIENICPRPDKHVKSLSPKTQRPIHGRKRRYK